MFRPDRQPRSEDPLLLVKMAIFFAAAVIATVGMARQRPWIIFAAIVLLGAGFLLRFLRPRDRDVEDEADGESAVEEDEPREG